MQATIQKWGNSLGVRIPSLIAKDLSLKNGSSVEILEEDDRIIIQPSKKKTLKEILELISEENIHEEQFSISTGREISVTSYFPDRGDVVWLDFDPQLGHEQSGKRPAIIFSPVDYNRKVGLALTFPITSQIKGYPFEVRIKLDKIDGVVLADQIKNLDWKARRIKYIEKAPEEIMEEIREKLDWILKK